ncbi:phosphatidylserine decarboxylase [Sulfitobacter sp.]|uniref:phosphatidylserine decarboxylase n=1 Tax=Sulfitobacter sp. TaxID=1903071 RepID=UPI00405869EC
MPKIWTYNDRSVHLQKREEMGQFSLGWTVITLFRKNAIRFNETWKPERSFRLGECMGNEAR